MNYEELVKCQEEAISKMKPFNDSLKKAQEEHNANIKPIEDWFHEKKNHFFDSQLIDKNGNVIKTGSVITNGDKVYLVESRRMDVMFGEIINNPQVKCKKQMHYGWGKLEYTFMKSELSQMWIVQNQ